METFIVLGFCFILYEALDFFQGCYTNNNLHEQQHPQFSKDITSGQTKATTTTTTTTQPLPASLSTSTLLSHVNESHEIESSSTFNASTITTIPLSDTLNSDLDLIAVDSNCVDSEFGTGVVEFDESTNDHEINGENGNSDYSNDDDDDDDNSDVSSDSDIKTIQINQSSSHRSSNRSRRIYSICDRVNHFNRHSELLIDYHCSSSGSK